MDISICIVSLNCSKRLAECLKTIPDAVGDAEGEVLVVDNQSTDGTVQMLKRDFPDVRVIPYNENAGFARAQNHAIAHAEGEFIVVLNPDTLAEPNSLSILRDYMISNPKAGVCGPKVLNEDLSFQRSCRRGISTPWAVISYFTKLDRVFRNNAFFTGYHLGHLNEDETREVGGVSGSCMMIRKEIRDTVGYFDEQFYLYQEDSDYCIRVAEAGWKVVYLPDSQIIHAGGLGGTRVNRPLIFRSVLEWHRSYFKLYRKHFAHEYPFLFNIFYYAAMAVKLAFGLMRTPLRRSYS